MTMQAIQFALTRFDSRFSLIRLWGMGYEEADPCKLIAGDLTEGGEGNGGEGLVAAMRRKAGSDKRDAKASAAAAKQDEELKSQRKQLEAITRLLGASPGRIPGTSKALSFADQAALTRTPASSRPGSQPGSQPTSPVASRPTSRSASPAPGTPTASYTRPPLRRAKEHLCSEVLALTPGSIDGYMDVLALFRRFAPVCSTEGHLACAYLNLTNKCTPHSKAPPCNNCDRLKSPSDKAVVLVELTRRLFDACSPALQAKLRPVLTV